MTFYHCPIHIPTDLELIFFFFSVTSAQIVNSFNELQGGFSWQDMVCGNRYRTIRWRFVESLEPPRVVHVRCEGVMNRGNLYGQVTVRMHSRQVSPATGPWAGLGGKGISNPVQSHCPGVIQHPGTLPGMRQPQIPWDIHSSPSPR